MLRLSARRIPVKPASMAIEVLRSLAQTVHVAKNISQLEAVPGPAPVCSPSARYSYDFLLF